MIKKTPEEQLFIAVTKGNKKEIEKLMRENPTISANVADEKGLTLLHHAARHDQGKVVKILIQKGANIDAVDEKGDTPLHHAAALGKMEVAELLAKKGAKVSAKNNGGGTPLYVAASFRKINVAELLLITKDANINTADEKFGYTPLHLAARNHDTEMIQLLLKNGADFLLKDKCDKTPIYYLCNLPQENRQISIKPNARDTLIKSVKIGCTALLIGVTTLIMLSQFIELPPSLSAEAEIVFSVIGKIAFSAIGATALAAVVASAYMMLKPSTEMQIENNVEQHVSHKKAYA